MSTRRQFFGSLGRALLLPVAGTGAVAFADPAKAAALPVMTAAPLPFSADCLQLRSIKRALAALPTNGDLGHHGHKGPWYRMMTEEYRPVKMRLSTRPAKSWTDCVELAEIVWSSWEKENERYCEGPYTGRLCTDERSIHAGAHHSRHAIVALVEGVLTLGGGERFDPSMKR